MENRALARLEDILFYLQYVGGKKEEYMRYFSGEKETEGENFI